MTPEDEQELRDYLERAQAGGLVSKMRDSDTVLSLVPDGPTDLKFCLELGLAIMLDKPIIALVRPGTPVPDHLVRVADRIVEWQPDADVGPAIIEALDELS